MAIETIQDLRDVWEAGLEVLQVFDRQNTSGNITVVLKDYDNEDYVLGKNFRVMRYFPIGENWYASCDLDKGNLVEMLKTIDTATSI